MYAVRDWEKSQGIDTVERTANIGRSASTYRRRRKLGDAHEKDKHQHAEFIHRFGQDALEVQARYTLTDTRTYSDGRLADILRQKELGQLLQADLDTDTLIDWNTKDYDGFMVEAACEYLVLQFSSSHTHSSTGTKTPHHSKEKILAFAVQMIDRLIYRHTEGYNYIKKNIGNMIQKSANNLLYQGQCTSSLDLLYVLDLMTTRFIKEMTEYLFCALFCRHLMIEYALAATMIQHFLHRTNYTKYNSKYKNTYSKVSSRFMADQQASQLFHEQYNMKMAGLVKLWRQMHRFGCSKVPSHLDVKYVTKGIEIMTLLASSRSTDISYTNRVDIIKSHALILFAGLVKTHDNEHLVTVTCKLLYCLSLSIESLVPMFYQGCFDSLLCIVMAYQNRSSDVALESPNYIVAVNTITQLAVHVAGFQRASIRFNYIRAATSQSLEINYLKASKEHYSDSQSSFILARLNSKPFLRELIRNISHSRNIPSLVSTLQCLLALSCGPTYRMVVEEIGTLSGKFLFRLTELLQETDTRVSSLTAAFILQLCQEQGGRSCLVSSSVMVALAPLLVHPPAYESITYQYAVLILSALCRVGSHVATNPEVLPSQLESIEIVSKLIIEGLVRTATHADFIKTEKMDLANIVKLPRHIDTVMQMSAASALAGVKYLINHLTNPSDLEYYRSLSAQEYCSRALVINSLCAHSSTTALALTPSCIRYLCHTVYYASYLFQGRPMAEEKVQLTLIAVLNAAEAIQALCSSPHLSSDQVQLIISAVFEVNVIESCGFFIKTLSTFHIGLRDDLKATQEQLALRAVRVMDAVLFLAEDSPTESTRVLDSMGLVVQACVQVLKVLQVIYKTNRNRIVHVFNEMCWLLAKYCSKPHFALKAIQVHVAFEYIYLFIPTSEASIREFGAHNSAYTHLKSSFFHLLANLCGSDLGVTNAVTRGFLRIALEKLLLLFNDYSSDVDSWRDAKRLGRVVSASDPLRMDITACLKVINKCANFHHAATGNANELIFTERYQVIHFCGKIIRAEECPRNDATFMEAVRTLSVLSRDKASSIVALCNADVLRIARRDLTQCQGMHKDTVLDYILLVYSMASGLRIVNLGHQLLTLREPLFAAARHYPEFSTYVRDATWAIMESKLQSSAGISRAGNNNDDTLESFFTAKESFDLRELGIDVTERVSASRQAARNKNLFDSDKELSGSISVGIKLDVNVVDSGMEEMSLGEGLRSAPLLPSSPLNYTHGQSFIANDSRVNTCIDKKSARVGSALQERQVLSNKKRTKSGRRGHDKTISTVDIERLPELSKTRPPPSLRRVINDAVGLG